MHGIIFIKLQEFVTEGFGEGSWDTLTADSGVPSEYADTKAYPDEMLFGILASAIEKTGKTREEILMAFGEFLAPFLINTVKGILPPDKLNTIDVLEIAESLIHVKIREIIEGSTPPELVIRRINERKLTVQYSSKRKMVHFALGIINGFIEYFNEQGVYEVILTSSSTGAKFKIAVKRL